MLTIKSYELSRVQSQSALGVDEGKCKCKTFFKPVYQMTEGNGFFYLGRLQTVGKFQEIRLSAVSIYKKPQLVPIHINADVDIGYLK